MLWPIEGALTGIRSVLTPAVGRMVPSLVPYEGQRNLHVLVCMSGIGTVLRMQPVLGLLTYAAILVRLLGHFFAATPSTPLAGVTNVTIERLGINKGRCIETSLQAVRFSSELVI